jgi:hypothetical protein
VHEYDAVLKSLLQDSRNSSIFEQITGLKPGRSLNVEFPEVQQTRVDLLVETAGPDRSLINLELQSANDPLLPLRMAEYALRVYRSYQRFPRQYVLYVGEPELRMNSELAGSDFLCRFTIKDIRLLDEEALLESPFASDLIIAILLRHRDRRETIRRILSRIATRGVRDSAYANLLILAGLRKLAGTIRTEVERMPILNDIMAAKIIDASDPQEPVIAYFPGDTLFTPFERPRGLPLGNQTSQFFSNLYLNRFDHFVLRDLRPGAYCRYVDDFLIFHESKEFLQETRQQVENYLLTLRLTLHQGKSRIYRSQDGFTFLGWRIFPTHRRLVRANVVRFERRLRARQRDYEAGLITWDEVAQRVASWNAHAAQWRYLALAPVRKIRLHRAQTRQTAPPLKTISAAAPPPPLKHKKLKASIISNAVTLQGSF